MKKTKRKKCFTLCEFHRSRLNTYLKSQARLEAPACSDLSIFLSIFS